MPIRRNLTRLKSPEKRYRVTEEEIKEAYEAGRSGSDLEVIRKALVNIRSYHEKQRQNSWFTAQKQTEPCLVRR